MKPGSGGATLAYYNKLYHKRALKNSESRLAKQFNDVSFLKHRSDLQTSRVQLDARKLKQIDSNNLQLFVKLSSV